MTQGPAARRATLPFRRICVFAGSSSGADPSHRAAARALGAALAGRGIELVYGGARIGVMGATAAGALEAGGRVIGVIPEALMLKEVVHDGLTELHITDGMHGRKAKMAELSDAFIAAPGGIGTLEELFEIWTWTQLGAHAKPCGLLNVSGFYDPLLAFLEHVVDAGFLRREHYDLLSVAETPTALLDAFAERPERRVAEWIGLGET
ncbi:MAG: TIGR00730 family Rossman fold protein [Pseudomonadota bacterium]